VNEELKADLTAVTKVLSLLKEVNVSFLNQLSLGARSPDCRWPVEVDIAAETIRVSGLGHTAVAVGRVAYISRGSFAVEYVYHVQQRERKSEVWRCYLDSDGFLADYDPTRDHHPKTLLWHFAEHHVLESICVLVLHGMLKSSVFQAAGARGA